MSGEDLNSRLSQISTVWTVLHQAHRGNQDQTQIAVQLLVERYRNAVFRYLRRLLGSEDAAEDLTQEFCVGLLRGELRHADPGRGKFRHYVKASLFHLVARYRQRQNREARTLEADSPAWLELASGESEPGVEADREFTRTWCEELLGRALEALRQAHKIQHAVLQLRIEQPEMPMAEMAQWLSTRLGRDMTTDTLRQNLHRAREKFAGLLLDEVAHSLDSPDVDRVTEELADLGLLEHCRPLLDR